MAGTDAAKAKCNAVRSRAFSVMRMTRWNEKIPVFFSRFSIKAIFFFSVSNNSPRSLFDSWLGPVSLSLWFLKWPWYGYSDISLQKRMTGHYLSQKYLHPKSHGIRVFCYNVHKLNQSIKSLRGVKQECSGTANDRPGVEFTIVRKIICSIRSRGVDRCLLYLDLPTTQIEIICSEFFP